MAAALKTIALDLGTSAIKVAICDKNCQIETLFSQPSPKIHVNNGHYESDAIAYLKAVNEVLEKCLQSGNERFFLGICYQRSTFVIWDSRSGVPVTRLISWQDNRGAERCTELQAQQANIRQLSGLPLSAYFFAPKLSLLLKQQPALRRGLLCHDFLAGTLDTFLIWHWSTGKQYLTDASMAARTLLMDIDSGKWSPRLAEIFNIPLQVLPDISASCNINLALNNGAILQASVADQSAALLASVANNDADVLVNLGTGGFVVRYEPTQTSYSRDTYLRTLVYQTSLKDSYIAIEGTLNSISAALQPYPFKTCTLDNLAEIKTIYCISEPSGLGAPYFRADIGLKFSAPTEHLTDFQIASLLLEGIIFRVALILEEFNQQAKINRVYLSGGLSTLPCLQQGIACCTMAAVHEITQKHSGLMGVAMLVNGIPTVSNNHSEPVLAIDHAELYEKYQRWKNWFNQLLSRQQ